MAESIPGGAFIAPKAHPDHPDRWVNANGEPLTEDQAAEAMALHAANDAALRQAERDRQALEVQRNPAAQAIAAALAPKPRAVAKPKDEPPPPAES